MGLILSAREPGHPLAIYGPLAIEAGKAARQDITLEPFGTLGEDAVRCEFSLVRGMVRGLGQIPPVTMLLCMSRVGKKAARTWARMDKSLWASRQLQVTAVRDMSFEFPPKP